MKKRNHSIAQILFVLILFIITILIFILTTMEEHGVSHGGEHFAQTILLIFMILLIAKLSSLVEQFGQPSVLGELLAGVLLGNLGLLGIHFFSEIGHNEIIIFLAELGVVVLLFQIGLESKLHEMLKVGGRAVAVAVLGVVIPFLLGYFVSPFLLPGLSTTTYLFIGASLTATSVGITARVFKDLGKLQTKESKIVLGAAVIDDILGLIILAVVSAIATSGHISVTGVGFIFLKSILFLLAAVVLGQIFAPSFNKLFSRIQNGVCMKFTLALCFALLFAYLAHFIGLAPIIGAFAAGLVLEAVHFRYFKESHIIHDLQKYTEGLTGKVRSELDYLLSKHKKKHIEDLIEPISFLLVPIFFVYTGFQVDLSTLFQWEIFLVAVILSVIAIVGKVASGILAGPVNKWIVGFGMVPRGEVGLIFASIGKGLGVVNDSVFSVVVIMVIATTLLTPPVLNILLKMQKS